MTATIFPFVRRVATTAAAQVTSTLAEHFAQDWAARHMPLVAAALDMLQANEADFGRRCTAIAAEPGALDRLCAQLSRLAAHLQDVADGMAMVVQRIQAAGAVQLHLPA